MERNQLYKEDANGIRKEVFPITNLESVKDYTYGNLKEILSKYNHIYLGKLVNNSKSKTRLKIPSVIRRKGLVITYISCKNNVITEQYIQDNTSDSYWQKNENWERVVRMNDIENSINEKLSWH